MPQLKFINRGKAAKNIPTPRAARACTVCRGRKAKCEGADNGKTPPCNFCKARNEKCIFKKHQRGRKKGTKLSYASKQLRQVDRSIQNDTASHKRTVELHNEEDLEPLSVLHGTTSLGVHYIPSIIKGWIASSHRKKERDTGFP